MPRDGDRNDKLEEHLAPDLALQRHFIRVTRKRRVLPNTGIPEDEAVIDLTDVIEDPAESEEEIIELTDVIQDSTDSGDEIVELTDIAAAPDPESGHRQPSHTWIAAPAYWR